MLTTRADLNTIDRNIETTRKLQTTLTYKSILGDNIEEFKEFKKFNDPCILEMSEFSLFGVLYLFSGSRYGKSSEDITIYSVD